MIRVGISVEGETEEAFVKEVIYPHLLPAGIVIRPILMGGNISLDRVVPELSRMYHAFDYVTTFYDFYGFKRNSCANGSDLEQKMFDVVSAQVSKSNTWDARKFKPYIQMYEFEALLFSNVDAFDIIPNATPEAIETLRRVRADVETPEQINNDRETAPSKRVMNAISNYDKVEFGALVVLEIELGVIRAHCPRFDGWMHWLEGLRT